MIRKTIKFIIIAFGILAGLVILSAAAVLLLINTDIVRRTLIDQANAVIPGHLEWRSHEIKLFQGRIAVDDLSIAGPDNDLILAVDRIRIGVDLSALFRRELKIDGINVEHPRALLAADEKGYLNLAAVFVEPDEDAPDTPEPAEPEPEPEPDAAAPGFNVRLIAVELNRGYFQFQTAPASIADRADIIILEDIGISLKNADLAGRSGRLTLSIGGGRVDMAGIQTGLEKFFFDAGLDQHRLDPFIIDIATDGPKMMLSGTAEQLFDRPEINLELEMTAELADIRRMLEPGVDLSGPLHLRLSASGPVDDPEATLSAEYGGGNIAGQGVDAVHLAMGLSDRRVRIRQLSAAAPIGRMDITGAVDLTAAFPDGFTAGLSDIDAITCDIDVKADVFDLARAGAAVDLTGPGGGLILSAGITGQATLPVIRVNLNGNALSWDAIRIGDLKAEAEMDLKTGAADIQKITLANQQSSVNLSGSAHLLSPGAYALADDPAFNLELTDGMVVAENFSDDVKGRLAFSAGISGTLRRPAATLSIQGRDLAAMNRRIGDLTASIRLADGRITIDPLKLVNDASVVMITGTADVLDPETGAPISDPEMDIVFNGTDIRIGDFAPEFSGRISIDGHIRGTAARPEGHLRALADDIDVGVQKIAMIGLDARLDGTRVHIDPLTIGLAEDQSITLAGWVDTTKHYDLRLTSDPIAASAITAMADVFPDSGIILLEATGAGTFDDPRAEADIALSDFRINRSALPELHIVLSVADHAVAVTGASLSDADSTDSPNLAAERLFLDARLDFEKQDFTANIELGSIDLAPYLEMAALRDFSGNLTANLRADGNLADMDRIRAEIHIADFSLRQKNREIARTADFQALYDKQSISIPGSRMTLLGDGFLTIAGTGRMDGDLDFQAEGALPVSLAESFTDAVADAGGRVDMTAGVSGTASDPIVTAGIVFNNIGLTLTETAQRLHELNGSIRVTSDRIEIQDARGRLDTGDFSLSGAVDLADFQPVTADVAITARALPIKIPDTLDLLINAAVNLKGNAEKSILSGEITLLDGLYYRDIEFSLMDAAADAGRGRRQFSPPPDAKEGGIPLLEKMAIDIAVRHRNPFVVDNNMAVLRIRPDIRVHGTPSRPLLDGRAEVTDGAISFYNTEFTVQRGIIDFINPYKIEPTIDIAAQSQVRHWTITLSVAGSPDELILTLNSKPAEEHGDIVSLLLVGKTTRELAGGEGGGTVSPEQLLANLLAEQLQKNLRAGTGLDIIELEYNADSESDAGEDFRVTVGKELSRRLTLLYGVEQKSGLVVQKSTAIYKLLENLSVNAFQDTEGAFGGEMRYRLEFR